MTAPYEAPLVDRALDALRDHPIPEGPSAELLQSTKDRLHSVIARPIAPRTLWRFGTFRMSRFSGLISICTLIAVGAAWMGLINHSAAVVFAEVQQQVKKLRTAQYVSTRLVDDASDDIDEMRNTERMGKSPPAGKVFRVSGDEHQPRIIRVEGRHLQRTETLNAQGEVISIQICDFKNGRHVTLLPKEKRFLELVKQVKINLDSGKTTEEKVTPSPEVDLYAQISEVPALATTQLPVRRLEGKEVIGFFWEQKLATQHGTTTWERTYWVDLHTKLPVRIEVCCYSTDERMRRSEWIQSGFIFDAEFPTGLFSTEPPEGYQREPHKVMGIQLD